jgi:signal peptidase I
MKYQRLTNLWRSWWPSLIVIVVVLSFRSAVANWYDVPTGSMQPTIYVGDRIVVDLTAYDWKVPLIGSVSHRADPERGDIVTFPSPKDGIRLVKRILAVPGDVVEMKNNKLILNGKLIDYQPQPNNLHYALPPDETAAMVLLEENLAGVHHSIMLTPSREVAGTWGPIHVPNDRYLMIGDNRDNSADSRWFGLVEREAIEGRAHTVAMSLDLDRWWMPRWGRFFRSLS